MSALKQQSFQVSALDFLSHWEKGQKNYEAAMDYQDERMEVLTDMLEENNNRSVYAIEQKYNYEQMQKQYYQAIAIRQRWIIILLAVVILGVILFALYSLRQKKKRDQIQHNINTLRDMNRDLNRMVSQMDSLRKLNDELKLNLSQKQLALRNDLLWRFGLAKKVIKLNAELAKSSEEKTGKTIVLERFNEIVYGKASIDEQWQALLQTFEQARPGYAQRIRHAYPELTDAEFRICVLTYADFDVKEIAIVLKQMPNTVQTRRTSLRQKLGIAPGGNISKHIDDMLG